MSASIEWGEVPRTVTRFSAPGEIEDAFGNQNDELALSFGECVVEGTADEWLEFARQLLGIAVAEVVAEAGGSR